ncbi:MAG: DUF2267 domain-containing protein [Reyranellales bacterium]
MGSADFQNMGHSVQITHAWIDELDQRLGWNDKPRSYRLLMAVLHAVWEWSSVNETADHAVHFPVRLCGTNYEQWQTSATALTHRGARDFMARVGLWFMPDPVEDASAAIEAVFDLLAKKLDEDKVQDMRRVLPAELQRAVVGGYAQKPIFQAFHA